MGCGSKLLATISEPLEAIRRWVRLDDWCLVIVGDGKKYETGWTKGEGNDVVVVLSPDDQKALNFAFFNAVSNTCSSGASLSRSCGG